MFKAYGLNDKYLGDFSDKENRVIVKFYKDDDDNVFNNDDYDEAIATEYYLLDIRNKRRPILNDTDAIVSVPDSSIAADQIDEIKSFRASLRTLPEDIITGTLGEMSVPSILEDVLDHCIYYNMVRSTEIINTFIIIFNTEV